MIAINRETAKIQLQHAKLMLQRAIDYMSDDAAENLISAARNQLTAKPQPDMKREPLPADYYQDAALHLGISADGKGRVPEFNIAQQPGGITATQAREAAHLLNQLAEYLEQ